MSNPNKAFFEKYIDPQIKEIDRVNVYEFENGMDYELLQLGGKIDHENIKKAQTKVLKNLKKDPAFYTNQLAAESIKLVGEYGSGKKPGTVKAEAAEKVKKDGKLPKDVIPKGKDANESKTVGKVDKANVSKDKKITNPNKIEKPKQESYTAKKAKGIKQTFAMPGKEKKLSLKEALSDNYVPLKDRPVPSNDKLNAEWEKRKGDFKKSMGDQLGGNRKVKLTQEMKNSIVSMIKETVAMVTTKVGTKAVSYNNPAELNSLKSDANVTGIETSAGQKLK